MKTYTIFSPRIARNLIRADFKIIDIRPNKDVENATVFEFEYTDELIKFMKQKFDIEI